MKLLTLNTHSLVEPDYENKLQLFVEALAKYQPDIVALQEVNQSRISPEMPGYVLGRYMEVEGNKVRIKRDNHAFQVVKRLEEKGIFYNWTWLPVHVGYGKFDEGLAILSQEPMKQIKGFFISEKKDYNHFKTRKALAVQTQGLQVCCVHMGWWGDEEESYVKQWENLEKSLDMKEQTILLGDCNVRSDIIGEGYDWIRKRGWQDTILLAEKRDDGITVPGAIDGWKEERKIKEGMRIDYIWCKEPMEIKSSKVIFNGRREEIVSDHFGILVETC